MGVCTPAALGGLRNPVNQVRVSESVPLTVAFQTIHTVHFQRHLTIKNIHLTNTTGADVTIQITLNPAGVAPQQSAALLWDFTIPANDFLEFGEGLIVEPSGSISALASADNAIVMQLCGIED